MTAKVSKMERLLTLMDVLVSTSRPLILDEIFARVPGYPTAAESFRRTFERDKADLREMGLPLRLINVPGTDPPVPGYRINPDEYALKDPGLEPDELEALRFATALVGSGSRGRSALLKLGAGDSNAQPHAEIPTDPELALLFAAMGERRRVSFEYKGERRTVDPHRLSLRRGRWYLGGHDHLRGGHRWFRLSRIEGTMESTGPAGAFEFAANGSDLQLIPWALGESDRPTIVTVRFDEGVASAVRAEIGDAEVVSDGPDGLVLRLAVTNMEGFRSWLFSFLDRATVLDPPEVRREVIEWLRELSDG